MQGLALTESNSQTWCMCVRVGWQVLRDLVERCWHQDPAKRPSFEEIVKILDSQITKLPRREVMGTGSQAQPGACSCCTVQ